MWNRTIWPVRRQDRDITKVNWTRDCPFFVPAYYCWSWECGLFDYVAECWTWYWTVWCTTCDLLWLLPAIKKVCPRELAAFLHCLICSWEFLTQFALQNVYTWNQLVRNLWAHNNREAYAYQLLLTLPLCHRCLSCSYESTTLVSFRRHLRKEQYSCWPQDHTIPPPSKRKDLQSTLR